MTDRVDEQFKSLFRDCGRAVRAYLSKLTVSRDVAEELSQEAFARIYANRSAEVGSLRSYLFKTAHNLGVDYLRHRQALSIEAMDLRVMEIASDSPSAESALGSRQELALLHAAIAELPPKCRLVFLLLRVEGRSYKEVAAQMALSETMVRKYARRALEHCQMRLANANGERPRRGDR
jgi:RNA polymerase sigma-70 factor (ECF subfamily)